MLVLYLNTHVSLTKRILKYWRSISEDRMFEEVLTQAIGVWNVCDISLIAKAEESALGHCSKRWSATRCFIFYSAFIRHLWLITDRTIQEGNIEGISIEDEWNTTKWRPRLHYRPALSTKWSSLCLCTTKVRRPHKLDCRWMSNWRRTGLQNCLRFWA